jgi:hypothetical protein
VPGGDVLDIVRRSTEWVAERATHVRIDEEALAAYHLDADADADAGPAAAGDEETTAALVIQLDAINFGSGWHPVLRKPPGRSGSDTIDAAYRDHAARFGVLTADELTMVTGDRCARMLGQDMDGEAGELMGLYARSLQQLGGFVRSRFAGRFTALVAEAGGSAARLVELLLELPMYHDAAVYRGRRVPLLKRAQITVHDLATAFGERGPGSFADVDRLTLFADNLVPHVLRIDGVLRLDPDLEARTERGELLVYGSPEEVELRATAVTAVERLAERTGVASRHLDGVLWRRGGQPAYKAVPRPRCRATAY